MDDETRPGEAMPTPDHAAELTRMTAARLAAAIAGGQVSALEVTDAHLGRIDAVNRQLHAFLHIAADGARASARAVDERRAAGDVLGRWPACRWPSRTSSPPRTCRHLRLPDPRQLAAAVRRDRDRRLREAGVVLLGKTNMDEFAMGSSTEHRPTGHPTTRGTWPGYPGARRRLGRGGGGLRGPARHRHRHRRVDPPACRGVRDRRGQADIRRGVPVRADRLRSSLDKPGPLARTVLDAALLHEAISGHDQRDSTSVDAPVPPVVAAARQADVSGLRIGVVPELSGEGYQPGVLARFNEAVEILESLGAKIVEVSCPHFTYALAAYYLIAPSECSSNLARYDGMRYGLRVGDDGTRDAEEVMLLTRAAGFGPEVKRRIMLGTYALSSGYYDAYYGKAQKVRTLITRDFEAAFEQVDVLISPTTPTTAFPMGERADDPMAMYLADLCTIPSNLAGNAALSVPCGLAPEDGLPVGLQIMAPVLADDRMYRVAAAVEAALTQRRGGPLLDAIRGPAGLPAPRASGDGASGNGAAESRGSSA